MVMLLGQACEQKGDLAGGGTVRGRHTTYSPAGREAAILDKFGNQ